MKPWKLNRTRQCAKCPWKVTTNPHTIPNGYSVELHQRLENTISDGSYNPNECQLKIMACHESPTGSPDICIGWLDNQLGRGNNVSLRIRMLSCENTGDVELVGEQHQCFEDTLPS